MQLEHVYLAISLASPFASMAVSETAQTGRVVWNQAYQENGSADPLDTILDKAENAYVLLDPFTADVRTRLAETVRKLHNRGNDVGAYISIGTGEEWRDDFPELRPHLADRPWQQWAGEYFVSTPNNAVLNTMKRRIDKVSDWSFDWVDFDNMDWVFDDELRIKYAIDAAPGEAIAYFRSLCAHVHTKGMKCMAKNTVRGAEIFDGVTYESYVDDLNWWDNDGASHFLTAGKQVIIVHYNEPNCASVYARYRDIYGQGISFMCEDPHYNGYRRSPDM